MPKRRQSKADGHYFIVGRVQPADGMATWQLSDEGFAVLCSYGKTVGDEIPWTILSDLIHRSLAYTGGSGIVPVDRVPLTPPDYGRLQLGMEVSEGSWSLSVLFPELPADWAADPTLLARCAFEVSGTSLSAIRLWPGKGGAVITVTPQERPYLVIAGGQWPTSAPGRK